MAQGNAVLEVTNLTHVYTDSRSHVETKVVDKVSLSFQEGKFVCVLGPSGCGKTTMLNIIAGFIRPTSGSVMFEGKEVKSPGPERAMVFQDYALFPWLTVSGNIQFGLMMKNTPAKDREAKVAEYLEMMGMKGFEHKYPFELSGGMKQRVGLARALAVEPKMLLLDEPFGSLDAQTRRTMQRELFRIMAQAKKTSIFVTHSIDEALFLSDRLIVMSARPAKVLIDIELKSAKPRQRTDKEYSEVYEKVDKVITAEVSKSIE
ncbi:MAG: ABC transporter ATP-binding protein [Nitrososphaerota archaeon]|nr:ABC transporter ATP-binding protein [Nitrososphaerota archaeon]